MRKALVTAGLVIAGLGLVQPASTRAQIVSDYVSTGSEAVVDGVSHEWGTSQTDKATQRVNVLRVAHDAADVSFELGLPFNSVNGRQRTTNQAIAASAPGHRVVAAVNGDFWQTRKNPHDVSAPAGLNIGNGELVSGNTAEPRGALGFTSDGAALIGTPTLTVTVTLPGDVTAAAAGVNRVRHTDELVVYSPRFGVSTATDATGTEVVLTGANLPMTTHGTYSTTVRSVHANKGDTTIGPGELVLSATGPAATALSALAKGNAVTITTAIDADWNDVTTAVGGILLYTPDETPDLTAPPYDKANPRTAVGVTDIGDVLLITIDGRSETSGGMVLTDVVTTLRSIGAVRAINLDGGGSTTMAVDPAGDAPLAVANDPSQTFERQVNTTLQVVSTAQDVLPTVSAPTAQIVANVAAGKLDAAVRLSWSPAAPVSVASTQLQRRGGDGLWHDVALSDPPADSVVVRFRYGKSTQFRVRVTNGDGMTSDWATSPEFVLRRFNESSPEIVRGGTWQIQSKSTAIGQHLARSAYDGKSHLLTMDLNGAQVAVVAQRSRNAGNVQVTIGTTSAVVDTNANSTQPRMVVYVGSGESISISNAASSARPNVDIDALLVLGTT